jgi:hypothetical protein
MTAQYSQSGLILTLVMNNVKSKEVSAIRDGKLEIGFVLLRGIIFFTLLAKGTVDFDAPFTVNNTEEKIELPEKVEEGIGTALIITLLEGKDTVVRCQRLIGCPTEWSRKLITAMKTQQEKPISAMEYIQTKEAITRAFSTEDLISRATKFKILGKKK